MPIGQARTFGSRPKEMPTTANTQSHDGQATKGENTMPAQSRTVNLSPTNQTFRADALPYAEAMQADPREDKPYEPDPAPTASQLEQITGRKGKTLAEATAGDNVTPTDTPPPATDTPAPDAPAWQLEAMQAQADVDAERQTRQQAPTPHGAQDTQQGNEAQPQTNELRHTTFAELFSEDFPIDCIDGLLPETGYGFLAGGSGDGKSFIGIDMAFAIASKKEWFGEKILFNRPVDYFYLEAPKGLLQRVLAYQKGKMERVDDTMGVRFYRIKIDLRKQAKQIAENAKDNAVIFIDTTRAASRGVDENSSKDMGELLAAVDTILEMRPNVLIVLVHHVTKGRDKKTENEQNKRTEVAGWSGLTGNCDFVLMTNRKGENRTLCNSKVRDDKDGTFYSYRLQPIHVGERKQDGKKVFSCYIDFQGIRDGSKNEGLSPRAQRVLKAMDEAEKRLAREEIPYQVLKDIFTEQSEPDDTDKAISQAFKEGRSELIKIGRLIANGTRAKSVFVRSKPNEQ